MNEDHIIAAILTSGLIARGSDDSLEPRDTVRLYEMTLTELIATNRPPRSETTE